MSVNLGSTGHGFVTWWNGAGLAFKFSISLGALIVLVIIAAVIKLIIDKVRLRKHIKREKREKAAKAIDYTEEIAIKRISSLEEGDLFGVRAIQSGYFGGVAQSLPSSPVGSRAPSLYNQPTSPSGPLNGSSPYIPLMQPQAAASPMGSTSSIPVPRSPLGFNSGNRDGQSFFSNGPPSPVPSALIRDSQRPSTSGSDRGFERSPLHGRSNSTYSSRTINLDGLAPVRQQNGLSSLRPSASDASNTSPPSTNNGTSHGSRSSSFTSTYSFEEGIEQQPQNPTIVKPFEGLPTLPVLQPLSAEVHNVESRRPSPVPIQEGLSSLTSGSEVSAELATDLPKSPPRNTNFSTPFRRPSQPEHMIPPPSPGFGPLPAAAMNAGPQQFVPSRTQSPGPQQFGPSRTQSPGPMYRAPVPQRVDSPGPFPTRGSSAMDRSMSPAPRTMSPGSRNQVPPRQGPQANGSYFSRPRGDSIGQRRQVPAPLQITPHRNAKPSLPAFLQDGLNSTELDMPQDSFHDNDNEPRSAPPTNTNSSQLLPDPPRKNRLTADILNDFYDSYSYTRNSKEGQQQQQPQPRPQMNHPNQSNQLFEMQSIR